MKEGRRPCEASAASVNWLTSGRNAAVDSLHIYIEMLFRILEDPQINNLIRHPGELRFAIVGLNGRQDEQAAADLRDDLAIDGDTGF